MTALSDLSARLEERIRDTNSLVVSSTALTEAIRSAVARLSEVYGSLQTLEGLDSAATTTIETMDYETLLIGAELQILGSLLTGHFSDFSGSIEQEKEINLRIKDIQKFFEEARERIRKRMMQKSADSPFSEWEMDEEYNFD